GAAGRLGVRHRRAVAPRAAVPAGQRGQSRDAVVPDREGDAAVLHDGDQRLGRGGAAAHVAMARGTYASASGVATLPWSACGVACSIRTCFNPIPRTCSRGTRTVWFWSEWPTT